MQGKTEGKRGKGQQRMKWLGSIIDSQTEETGNMTSEAFSQALMWTSSKDLVGRWGCGFRVFLLYIFCFSNLPLLYLYTHYAFPSQGPSKTERVLAELGSAHRYQKGMHLNFLYFKNSSSVL